MKSFPGKREGILLLNEGLSLSQGCRCAFLTSAAGSCLSGCEDKSRHYEPLGEACPAQPSLFNSRFCWKKIKSEPGPSFPGQAVPVNTGFC